MPQPTPGAEFEITPGLVRALLLDQHPDLADLQPVWLTHGWDNVMFRLGSELVVRLPRRAAAAALLRNEQRWLPELAPRLPIPIPTPLRVGVPACGYPWRFSVLPWLAGEAADLSPPDADQAEVLTDFLRALHQHAPESAPANAFRGVPLAHRERATEDRVSRLRARTDRITRVISAIWRDALCATPTEDVVWLHGDLHPRNMLVENGRLNAIIDWGDVTAGDAATDLASFWMLFEERSTREAAIRFYSPDDATLRRARGWAIVFAAALLDTGLVDDPRHEKIGHDTFRRLACDFA